MNEPQKEVFYCRNLQKWGCVVTWQIGKARAISFIHYYAKEDDALMDRDFVSRSLQAYSKIIERENAHKSVRMITA